MKKIYLLNFLLFQLLFMPFMARAQERVLIDGIYYNFTTSEAVVTHSYNHIVKYKGDVIVPSSVIYEDIPYPVTSIDAFAFSWSTDLKTVTLPTSINSIGDEAFEGCNSLTSITIPNSVTSIGKNVFYECSNLKTVNLSGALTRLGDNMFYGCESLESIELPEGVQVIGDGAFQKCKSLTSITFPTTLKEIEGRAFYECESLESMIIPNTVHTIGEFIFGCCYNLASITIPESVKTFGRGMFRDCQKLTSFSIPQAMTRLEEQMFQGCTLLESVTIHDGVTAIDDFVFRDCPNLKTITLPASLTKLGGYSGGVFSGCTSLQSITIPNTITDIRGETFKDCEALTELIIPNSITSIRDRAFSGSGLTSLSIPVSVTEIGDDVFADCANLKFIAIPPSVFKMGDMSKANFEFAVSMPITPVRFPNGCKVFVEEYYVENYKKKQYNIVGAEIYPLSHKEATQSSITYTPSLHVDVKSLSIDGNSFSEVGTATVGPLLKPVYSIDGLAPETLYYINVVGEIWGNSYSWIENGQTSKMTVKIVSTKVTNVTASFTYEFDSGDTSVTKVDFGGFGNVKEITITDLKPGEYVNTYLDLTTSDGKTTRYTGYAQTKPIDAEITLDLSSTSCVLTGKPIIIDATLISSGFTDNEADILCLYGLEPFRDYEKKYSVTTKEGGTISLPYKFQTNRLILETIAAETISNTKARISATTNGADDSQRFGFEWRRYDAPEEMPSDVATAPVYNGSIAGTLNNLSPSTYYKYRAFYKSDAGITYYGEWVAFTTADAYVYFEPEIHTFDVLTSNDTKVVLKGIVVEGSDDVIEQGFEYWRSSKTRNDDEHWFVKAEGTLMKVELDDLEPGVRYNYRSYVKTASDTSYGEVLTFTAPGNVVAYDKEIISIGSKGKSTLTSSYALDFSKFEELKAYVATGYEGSGTIWMTRVKQVPAHTPIFIKGEPDQTYEVPVMDKCDAYFENMFKGSADEDVIISATSSDGKYKIFYMAGGVFKPASASQKISAGKAYLQVPTNFKDAKAGADQKVKIADSGKSSYAPPVDVDLTDVEGLKAYAATGYDAATSTIWLTRIFKIQAGEGVLLKGEAGKEYTLPSAEVQAYYGNMFVGNNDAPITINEASDDGVWTNFYLASGSFKKVSGSREIGTNKSYLQLPTSLLVSSARGKKNAGINEWLMEELETETMLLGGIGGDDDGTTRIDAISIGAQSDVYYNLQGQRVENPKKGLYIRNGKKVVIK